MISNSPDEIDSVCKQGTLKKVKTNKSRYFVLHRDTAAAPARLEYYLNKKEWDNRKKPKAKRIIYLKTCFSVNAFSDTKINYGLTLYTREDSLQVSFETEEDRDDWLLTITNLISANRDARPMFPFVWDVRIRDPSLGKQYEGDYRLCLTDRTVIFIKEKCVEPTLTFPIEVIRRCGHTNQFFNIEVGRQASTGAGEFWMDVFDSLIAQNVHQAILACMNNKPKDDLEKSLSQGGRGKRRGKDSSQHHRTSSSDQGDQKPDSRTTQSDINSNLDSQGPRPPRQIGTVDEPNAASAPKPSPSIVYQEESLENKGLESGLKGLTLVNGQTTPNCLPQQENYVAMNVNTSDGNSYMEMKPSGSMDNVMASNISMQRSKSPGTPPGNSKHTYLDMTGPGSNSSSSIKDVGLRLDRPDMVSMPPRHYSVGSRPTKPTVANFYNDQYVEMNRSKELTDKEKSSSVPHLMPNPLSSYPSLTNQANPEASFSSHTNSDVMTMLDFDRPRTNSESYHERPRVYSWSQAAHKSHNKKRLGKNSSSKESIKSSCSDYIDMQARPRDPYVEMGLRDSGHPHIHTHKGSGQISGHSSRKGSHSGATNHYQKHKISNGKNSRHSSKNSSFDEHDLTFSHKSDLSPASILSSPLGGDYVDVSINAEESNAASANLNAPIRRMSQSHRIPEPFPEISGSSEEDVSMRSVASSFSSSKSTSSSRSSLVRDESHKSYKKSAHHVPQMAPPLDPYVDCQSGYRTVHMTSSTKLPKPERVASFISEEPSNKKERNKDKKMHTSASTDNYFAMNPMQRRSSKSSLSSVSSTRSPKSDSMSRNHPEVNSSHQKDGFIGGDDLNDSYMSMTPSPHPQAIVHNEDIVVQKPKPVHPAVDSYMEMAPSETKATNQLFNSSNRENAASDSYIVMAPSTSQLQSDRGIGTLEPRQTQNIGFADSYMEMTPLQLEKQESNNTLGDNEVKSSEDSYMDMEPGNLKKSAKIDARALKVPVPKVDITAPNPKVGNNSLSPQPGLSELSETNSSVDSNNTVVNDDSYATMGFPQSNQERKSPSAKKRHVHPHKVPNTAVCYLRQDSKDNHPIFPSPLIPTQCYIRTDSNLSQLSEGYDPRVSPTMQNDILDNLASTSCATKLSSVNKQELDSYSAFDFSGDSKGVSHKKSIEATAPLSPIKLPQNERFDQQSSCASSIANEIPVSAAELNKQLKNLEQVDEECLPLSYIIEDQPLASKFQNSEPTQPPPLKEKCLIGSDSIDESNESKPLPVRRSDEASRNRPSCGASGNGGVITYVELDHSQTMSNNTTVTSKPESPSACESGVNYTQVDHTKTEALMKKDKLK